MSSTNPWENYHFGNRGVEDIFTFGFKWDHGWQPTIGTGANTDYILWFNPDQDRIDLRQFGSAGWNLPEIEKASLFLDWHDFDKSHFGLQVRAETYWTGTVWNPVYTKVEIAQHNGEITGEIILPGVRHLDAGDFIFS